MKDDAIALMYHRFDLPSFWEFLFSSTMARTSPINLVKFGVLN